MECDGITQKARACKRPAQWTMLVSGGSHAVRADEPKYIHYCGAHHAGAGAMRLLRPNPWDILSCVTLTGPKGRCPVHARG